MATSYRYAMCMSCQARILKGDIYDVYSSVYITRLARAYTTTCYRFVDTILVSGYSNRKRGSLRDQFQGACRFLPRILDEGKNELDTVWFISPDFPRAQGDLNVV